MHVEGLDDGAQLVLHLALRLAVVDQVHVLVQRRRFGVLDAVGVGARPLGLFQAALVEPLRPLFQGVHRLFDLPLVRLAQHRAHYLVHPHPHLSADPLRSSVALFAYFEQAPPMTLLPAYSRIVSRHSFLRLTSGPSGPR